MNKPDRLLAFLTKEAYNPITISKMKKKDGSAITNPTEINAIFQGFYETAFYTA